MKMTLLEFLTKVCRENYRPKKIVFENAVFEPITKEQRRDNEIENEAENEIENEAENEIENKVENENNICQYTSAIPLLDCLDDHDMADYKSLISWLMFGSWTFSDEENLLDFDKLTVTILEE